ncbi:MAG TPA: DUF4270 family protein, partial [Bacteroidales bacterium]|nr:DUF4270 family protein [Bacteroidales bacterium]
MRYRIVNVSWRYVIIIPLFFVISLKVFVSCEPELSRLGVDMFPSSDSIFVFPDTIRNFDVKLVKSEPRVTSVSFETRSDQRVFLLGSRKDTITGLSKAEIMAQMSIIRKGLFGEDPVIDSLKLQLYVSDVEGDTDSEMRLKIHEITERL